MEDNEREILKLKFKQGIYYILVTVLSLTALIVFPMLDASNLTFKNAFPTTPTGWFIWGLERTLIVIMNLLILTLFIKQARVNVKDDANYKKAIEILERTKPREYKPISPKAYYSKTYARKGTSLAFTTIASLFAIGDAVINYNYLLLIATAVTVIFAVTFGVVSMKDTEIYLTSDYLTWAEFIEKEKNKKCLQLTEKNSGTLRNKSRKTSKTSSTSSTNKAHSTNLASKSLDKSTS